jgi:uncharacterized protein (TIGR02001 family)
MIEKKLITVALVGALALPAVGFAEEAASPHTVTGNVGFFSDYSLRGLSQTLEQPAIQGGFDYAHSSGLYMGTWASNVDGFSLFPGGSMEWDLYGGWTKAFGDFGLNVGAYYYYYPGAEYANGDTFDFIEAMVAGTWKWVTAKLYYSVNDYLGANETSLPGVFTEGSDGSLYIDLTVTYPVTDAFSVSAHVGQQTIEGTAAGVDLDYTDYKIGVNYLWSVFNFGLAYKDTDAEESLYTYGTPSGSVFIGDSAVILSVSKTF